MATKTKKCAKPTAEKPLNGTTNAVKVYNTIKQHSQKHPAFTELALRNLIFNEKTNGLNVAIVRLGRRVLIDEAEFFNWIDRQRAAA